MYRDILVTTDGSDSSKEAGNHIIEFAKNYDATLHILSVVSVKSLVMEKPGEIEKIIEDAEKSVDDIARKAKQNGIEDIKYSVHKGSTPSKLILEYIDENNIDIVFMGTHGKSGIDKYLLGSTTNRVMRKSPIPVYIVSKEGE